MIRALVIILALGLAACTHTNSDKAWTIENLSKEIERNTP